jgi:hypothetical protein
VDTIEVIRFARLLLESGFLPAEPDRHHGADG